MLLFMTAFGLGIAMSTTPGALTVQVIRRGLAGGFRAALMLQMGGLIGLFFWAALAFVGMAVLFQGLIVRVVFSWIGAALLLWLAWRSVREPVDGVLSGAAAGSRGDFGVGAALSLSNPLPAVFWMGIVGTLLPAGTAQAAGEPVAFFAGFLSSTLLCILALSSLLAWGRKWVTPRLLRWLNWISGITLAIFGLSMVWNAIRMMSGT